MKILQVASDLAKRTGGPPVTILSNASCLIKAGHSVTIVAIDKHGPVLDLPVNSIDLYLFRPWGPIYFGFSLQMARFLVEKIRDFDLVIIHSLYLAHTAMAAWLASQYSIPFIIQPHGSLDPFIYKRHRIRKRIAETLFQNSALKKAAMVWYTTKEEKELAINYAKNPRYAIVYPFIDYSAYKAVRNLDVESRLSIVRHDPIILFLGRVNFKKGLDLLLGSYAKICARGVAAKLIIAGPVDAEMRPRLKEWESKLSLSGKVEYLGLVDLPRKLELLRSAAVFVLPSYSENFGIAVVEAIAAGVPVVVSDKVNIHREISQTQCGTVIAPEVDALTEALLEILSDDLIWKQQSQAGISAMTGYFDPEKNAPLLLQSVERAALKY